MRILVTNDDGILAPGIVALAEALSAIASVTVIAPDRNNSGVSSAISLETPLRVTEIKKDWFQLNGTPADCAKLALSGFLNYELDMVVSGINAGQNLGDDSIYSGTVAAAIEGRFLGMPSLAISLATDSKSNMDFSASAKIALKLVKRLIRHPLESGVILNVNVPNLPYNEIKGMQATRQGDRHFSEPMKPTLDGRQKEIYWMGGIGGIRDGGMGTDFHAVSTGYASITPLNVDLTDHKNVNVVGNWINEES